MGSVIQIPSSALMVLQPSQHTFEEHFIIRFPPSLAASVKSDLQETGLPGDLEINFNQNDQRLAKVKFDGRTYTGVLCDLPTILETHKTTDRSQYTKVADVHQILIVLDGTSEQARQKVEQYRASDFQLQDGLTPPMTNVKTIKFGSKAAENAKRMEEIERKVQELIFADEQALSSNYTLYDSHNRPIQLDRKKAKVTATQINETDEVQAEAEQGQDIGEYQEEVILEDNQESGDSDFAAELEEDLLDDLEQSMDESAHSGIIDETMENMKIDSQTISPQTQLPPELHNLQRQIQEKRAQMESVTNPAIKERLEDAIRYLEQQLESKLNSL